MTRTTIGGRIRRRSHVDIYTAALVGHLRGLTHTEDADVLAKVLTDLDAALRRAIPSYCGLELQLQRDDQPLTLTLVPPGVGAAEASLRLALRPLAVELDPGSSIVWYATAPGAFVDLAADLSYALTLPLRTDAVDGHGMDGQDHAAVVVDADLPGPPPSPELDGFAGLDRLAAVNRAVGVFIARGHHPDEAPHVLRTAALTAGLAVHVFAAQVLDGLASGASSERDEGA